MTKLLPQNFPPIAPASIASYDFTDIADGTGVRSFYGAVWTSGGADYPPAIITSGCFLTGQELSSAKIAASGAIIAGAGQGYINNNNFDISFSIPQRIKGNAYLQITLGAYRLSAVGSTPQIWVSGASLTNVNKSEQLGANITSTTLVLPSVVGVYSKTYNLKFDLSDKIYHFAKGDVLRLNLPLWGTGGSTDALVYGGYGTDPKARADTGLTISGAYSTQMVLNLPFDIDIGQ